MHQAATAATHDGAPVVALAHLAISATGDHAEIRPSILDLVDLVDTSTSLQDGSAMRAVAVHAAAPHQLASATPHIHQVAVRPLSTWTNVSVESAPAASRTYVMGAWPRNAFGSASCESVELPVWLST